MPTDVSSIDPATERNDLAASSGIAPAPAWREPALVLLLVVAAAVGCFIFEGHKGVNLMDEGFLWYGSQRILHGQMPLRDFMSYDIGRYYFAAAFMAALNDHGVIVLRAATALFGMIGIAVAAWLLRGSGMLKSWFALSCSVALLLLWAVPRHKLYDISTSIFIVAAVANLLNRRNRTSFFLCGLTAGVAALMGRNHGAYAAAASILAVAYLFLSRQQTDWRRGLPAGIAGVVAGFSPNLILMALAPGFAAGFIRSLSFTLAAAQTISYPVPWPWTVLGYPSFDATLFAVGCCYVMLCAFDALGAVYLIAACLKRSPVPPVLASAIIGSIIYSHHALFAPGSAHLAQAIFPMLIGLIVAISLMRGKVLVKCAAVAVLALVSAAAMLPMHPGYAAIHADWRRVKVGNDTLRVDQQMAAQLTGIQTLIAERAPSRRIVMLPFFPAFYAMYESPSPLFDIYAFVLAPEAQQRKAIELIEQYDPELILLWNKPPDGQNGWRFERTNPLVYEYLKAKRQPIATDVDGADLTAYGKPRPGADH